MCNTMEKYSKKNKSNKMIKNKSALDSEIARVTMKVLRKNQELKSFDTGFSSSVSTTGTLQKLTTIPQDDTDSGRDGDALRVVRLSLMAVFSAADTINICRLIIVRWNQDDSSSAPVSITDLLQTASPLSPYNRDNVRAKKFTVWFDHFFAVALSAPAIEKASFDRKAYSNIAFQATATTGTGHFYAFMVSDSAAIAHPVLSYVARVWYTDS